jgi:hypothetical protein
VRLLDTELVEQAEPVVRHVCEQIRRPPDSPGEDLARLRSRAIAQMRRAADVAVVVPDHEETAIGEFRAEVGVPADHLGTKTHDEQHGGTIRIAERLVAELDVPYLAEALVHLARTLPVGVLRRARGRLRRGR